jgi:E3 ubiquitin-protein ligase listerin
MLEDASPNVLHSSLGVLDRLVPPSSVDDEGPTVPSSFDRFGHALYARIIAALLDAVSEDRQLARSNIWALRHFLALQVYANDLSQIPLKPSPMFSVVVSRGTLTSLVSKTTRVTGYLLSPLSADEAASRVLDAFLNVKNSALLQPTEAFAIELLSYAQAHDSPRSSRMIFPVMQHLLSGAEKSHADQWTQAARKMEKQGVLYPCLAGQDN